MDKQELVSIIMPTYNRAHLLSRAIESVLSQTYKNLELIVVDDCSQDNTFKIIDDYIKKDNRIAYFKNKKNEGAAYSRNAGIEYSRGSFLMFLDDDCEYLPEKIEKEMYLMCQSSPPPSIIYSNMWLETKGTRPAYSLSKENKLLTNKDVFGLRYHFLEPTTWFCRSDSIKKVGGFDKHLSCYDDVDLLMRAILSSERIYFLNIALSIKHNVEGFSTLSFKSISNKEKFLGKHLSGLRGYKRYISRFYYSLGKDYYKLGEFKKAKKYFWKAFLSWPLKIEYLFKIFYLNNKAGHYGFSFFKNKL